jgi:hypothetical protein
VALAGRVLVRIFPIGLNETPRGDPVNPILLSIALSASGQAGATPVAHTQATLPARATTLEVTAEGAFEHRRYGDIVVDPSSSQALTAPGTLWTHSSGGAAWIGTAVSIGDVGGQVFAEYDLNNEAAELFSSYDTDPPTAIWTDNAPLGTEFRQVDSASTTDTHVAIDQIVLGGNSATRQAVLRKYSSGSGTPDWTYTFAPIINAAGKVAISRDGSKIVAAIMNSNTMGVEIAVFGPGSATPVSYTTLPVGASNSLRGWDLSADGSTLYFTQGTTVHIFDVATTTVTFTTNIGASFDSHALSGDGSVFAFGNFNSIKVWEKSGGTYLNTISKTLGGQVYCSNIDISDDSSTVAYAWYFYSPGLTVQVNALDVSTGTVTMTDVVTGTGTFQNTVGDVSCSADGSRFAVGLWGDQGNVAHEIRVYSSTQNAPIQTVNLPGSVFDIDLSPDGQRVAAASKAVHANTFGNGGRIDLVDTGNEDFMVRGAPRIGTSPAFEIHGTPGVPAVLLTSPLPENPPKVFPGVGTLYIKRSLIVVSLVGNVPGGGVLTSPHAIAPNPALIGTTEYFQILFLSPRVLSTDWVKLTYLP